MSFTGNRLDQDADEEEEEEDDDGDAYDDEKEEDEDGDDKDCRNRCFYHHLTQSMAILDLFVATNSNNRISLRNHAPP